MKGIVAICLKDFIIDTFGIESWENCLMQIDATQDISFDARADIDDEMFMDLVGAASKARSIPAEEILNLLGEYWICTFSQKVYGFYYGKYKTAKEFLLAMDKIHVALTKTLDNADPPRFSYEWEDDRTLILKYSSKRRMMDFLLGLVRGVGKYYRENLEVSRLGEDRVKIVFH